MDARYFDALTRTLSTVGSRRHLLRFCATVPVLGGLFALLVLDDTEAGGRRKRHKLRHKKNHRNSKGRRGNGKKKCKHEPVSQTCSGTCGSVINNCKTSVDCGSCACNPTCETCFTCQEGPNAIGACVVDPAQQGETCGDPGQVCQPDGACACTDTTCSDCTTCGPDGFCVPCDDCCDGDGVCQPGMTNAACGSGTCDICTGQEQCQSQSCVCVPLTTCPAEDECGTVSDGCSGQLDCGVCSVSDKPFCLDNSCVECRTSDDCEVGLVCDTTSHVCRSCTSRNECAPLDGFGNLFCEQLFDGSGQSICANFFLCTCPGTCTDCNANQGCFEQGGGICEGKNLCCPPAPAL